MYIIKRGDEVLVKTPSIPVMCEKIKEVMYDNRGGEECIG